MARFDILGLQYFTDGGDLLGGGKLNFYETGTTTRKNTFSDAGMTIANTNPVTLDADGRAPNIFFSGLAKCVLTDSTGAVLETKDPVGDDSARLNAFDAWSPAQVYGFNQPVTASDGYIYTSLIANNVANDPLSNPLKWQLIGKTIGFDDSDDGFIYKVDLSNPLKIGTIDPQTLQSVIFISTATISSAATVDFTDLDQYSQYIFMLKNITPGTGSASPLMRTSSDNGSTFDSAATNYRGGGYAWKPVAATTLSTPSFSTEAWLMPNEGLNTTNSGYTGQITLNKRTSEFTTFTYTCGYHRSATEPGIGQGYGFRNSTTQIDAVRFFMSAGNIASGLISVYGVVT